VDQKDGQYSHTTELFDIT